MSANIEITFTSTKYAKSRDDWHVQLQESKQTIDALEKERDFYFGKLRDIEVLCQEHENEGVAVLQQIMDILYATEVATANTLFSLLISHVGGCSLAYFLKWSPANVTTIMKMFTNGP